MRKISVPASTAYPVQNAKPNAAKISKEIGQLLMDTVRRNNQILDNVRMRIIAIGISTSENHTEIVREMQRVADELLEHREWNDSVIREVQKILENPLDTKEKPTVESAEFEMLLFDLETKFQEQIMAFSHAVSTKKKRFRHTRSRSPLDIPAEIILNEFKKIQQSFFELRYSMKKLERQAMTDGLTDLWNRNQIQKYIQAETERFRRYGHVASLVFLDVDHFKRINDDYGHGTGDKVLRRVAKILKENIRNTDYPGRWGGEEFVILLQNTDLTQAGMLAEKLREQISDSDTEDTIAVTSSFGVSQIEIEETWEKWVDRADSAMCRAKLKGRNRVETDYGNSGESCSVKPDIDFVQLHWYEYYNCWHPIIDRQHRWLLEGINSLISAMVNDCPKDELSKLMNLLLIEVVRHFHDEEAILSEAWYPCLDEHKKIHAEMVAEATELNAQLSDGEDVLWKSFQFLAYKVIAQHLLTEDRKFFPYVSQTGGK